MTFQDGYTIQFYYVCILFFLILEGKYTMNRAKFTIQGEDLKIRK